VEVNWLYSGLKILIISIRYEFCERLKIKRKEVIYRKKEMDRRVPDPKTQTKGGNLP